MGLFDRRLGPGLVFIILGGILLLLTTDLVESELAWASVPALFVLLGAWSLIKSRFRNLVGPGMVIAIAGTYFLIVLDVLEADFLGTWWPAYIVLFGVLLILSRMHPDRHHGGIRVSSDDADTVSVFGESSRRVTTDGFQGATVVSVFGESRLDLRDAKVDDPPATVEATAVFGESTIQVPEEWHVSMELVSFFGESQDYRRHNPTTDSTEPDLLVTGAAVFGSVSVTN